MPCGSSTLDKTRLWPHVLYFDCLVFLLKKSVKSRWPQPITYGQKMHRWQQAGIPPALHLLPGLLSLLQACSSSPKHTFLFQVIPLATEAYCLVLCNPQTLRAMGTQHLLDLLLYQAPYIQWSNTWKLKPSYNFKSGESIQICPVSFMSKPNTSAIKCDFHPLGF